MLLFQLKHVDRHFKRVLPVSDVVQEEVYLLKLYFCVEFFFFFFWGFGWVEVDSSVPNGAPEAFVYQCLLVLKNFLSCPLREVTVKWRFRTVRARATACLWRPSYQWPEKESPYRLNSHFNQIILGPLCRPTTLLHGWSEVRALLFSLTSPMMSPVHFLHSV